MWTYDIADGDRPWVPSRAIYSDYESLEAQDRIRQATASVLPVSTPAAPTDPTGKNGIPQTLLTVSATQGPNKQQGRTLSEVSVTFTRDHSDPDYSGVRIWFEGYQGNSSPQLVSSGAESPVTFLAEATQETVTVIVQPVGAGGASADLSYALSTTVTLSGVVSLPPAPTVTQTLVPLPLGFQFTFSVLGGLLADVISCYRVYSNTVNNSGAATLLQTFVQPPNNSGSIVVQDYTPGANTVRYYWVSAVNTAGLESALTSAQAGATTSAPVGTGQIANSSAAYTPTTQPLTQDGTTTNILVASFQIQFPAPVGLVTYNSGAVDPHSYGTKLIYTDDPMRVGGAQTYLSTTSSSVITSVDGRLYLGKITTAGGGGGTGSGGGGGACFTGTTLIQHCPIMSWQNGTHVRTARGTYLPATLVEHQYFGEMLHMGNHEYVTLKHRFLIDGKWIPAQEVFTERVWFSGKVYNLSISADDDGLSADTEHSYTLANGYVAHNLSKA